MDIKKTCYKRIQSLTQNHMRHGHSKSAQEQRVVLYNVINNNDKRNGAWCACAVNKWGELIGNCTDVSCDERPESFTEDLWTLCTLYFTHMLRYGYWIEVSASLVMCVWYQLSTTNSQCFSLWCKSRWQVTAKYACTLVRDWGYLSG